MRSKFSLEEKYDIIMECRTSGLSDFQRNLVGPTIKLKWKMNPGKRKDMSSV